MEHLRSSVSLRGYGQHDPLVEYKRESLRIFREMEVSMETSIANYLFYSLKESIKNHQNGLLPTRTGEVISGYIPEIAKNIKDSKAGRNDLCPCGSGKKYKKCHGKDA